MQIRSVVKDFLRIVGEHPGERPTELQDLKIWRSNIQRLQKEGMVKLTNLTGKPAHKLCRGPLAKFVKLQTDQGTLEENYPLPAMPLGSPLISDERKSKGKIMKKTKETGKRRKVTRDKDEAKTQTDVLFENAFSDVPTTEKEETLAKDDAHDHYSAPVNV